jgi:hypothetical protein
MKIIIYIKRYFVDTLIQIGIFILTNESLVPNRRTDSFLASGLVQSAQIKVFGIMLVSIGINIAIRKYFQSKRV